MSTTDSTPDDLLLPEKAPYDFRFEYDLLARLHSDCEYYLGYGRRCEKHLWAGSAPAQIAKMRELYDMLPEKPEWLTSEMIDRYEARMMGGQEPFDRRNE